MEQPTQERDRYIRSLTLWIFLGWFMDWNDDDFAAAADEAKKLGRGVTPQEIDAALHKLAEYSSNYVKRSV